MERDFLGTHAKNFHPDAAVLAGSPMQWPFSNKASAMQQFMLYKASQEERPRSQALRPQHLPKAAVFELNHGAHHALASQNFHGRHSIHGSFCPSSRHFTIPLTGNPYFKVQNAHYSAPNPAVKTTKKQPFVGGVEVGSFGHRAEWLFRNMAKQNHKAAAQMTIFYGGCVNVFDDVPFDKAQAVMSSLANSGPNVTSNGMKTRPISNSVSTKQSSARVVSPPSTASTGLKLVAPPISVNQQQAIPRAIPQARKASLARFLEKRKERLTSAVPYASTKISTENDWGQNASSSKSNSSADTNLSSYRMASRTAWML